MASPPPAHGNSNSLPEQGACEPAASRRPLQRQGAMFFALSEEEQALERAMLRSSSPPAETVLGKRGHDGDEGDDVGGDTEREDGPSPAGPQADSNAQVSNLAAACHRHAAKKKLRPEQRSDIDAFLLDSDIGRLARVYTLLLAVENQILAQQSAAPPWTLSDDLKTNINKYALAVMLSVKIAAYKGQVPANNILEILRRFRFDLPPGIEHDYANWEKVTTQVSDTLTQIRAKMKKQIRESIANNTNIYRLTQAMASGLPNARPTVQLCARIALMRCIYVTSGGGEKYWNAIDKRLKFIRDRSGGEASRVAKAFKQILKEDRETYGIGDDYDIKDLVANDWQVQVDNIVEGLADSAVEGAA
ncbi:hypothetical protein CVT26_005315 [Gymnopilus dilepis]|uniref:Uncharacterized protein n=1 Tax=Gymnopilus dilepis TaxID=231916 RepID=A0A409WJB5_9AGAR|nr:hypothetical protein CVT26_005315 [Gymnopilus dilepis]